MGASFSVRTAMLWGAEARPVTVEVSLSAGLPGISIVGCPDQSVNESRLRVRCALRAAGFQLPRQNVTVNLAPAELKKSGTAFDLPMAVAILAATRQIPTAGLEGCMLVGELSLEGDVRPVRGLMAYAELASESGLRLIAPHGALNGVDGRADVRFVSTLAQFSVPVARIGEQADAENGVQRVLVETVPDFADVSGQEIAKRALAIAAAGRLGVMFLGPPGVGKTMLARCLTAIEPDMTPEEYRESCLIHSVAGVDDPYLRAGARPFRAPHHSASAPSLLGGGRPVRPGEISLAHNGVLFLDELGEFNRLTLQALRQPMEERVVRVARVEGVYAFPCDFQLVAASNPCPCGHLGDIGRECTCSQTAIERYRAKLAGPLFDRIAITVQLERPGSAELFSGKTGASTKSLKQQVEKAREFARFRRSCEDAADVGGPGTRGTVARALERNAVDERAARALEEAAGRRSLSVRAVSSVVCIARTIADMEESPLVRFEHVGEAMGYRREE